MNELKLDRRRFCRIAAGLGVLGAASLGFAQTAEHRVLAFPKDPRRPKPPVMTSVCLQPGGPLLAAVGDDHCVRVWDRDSGQQVHCLEGHADWVRAAAFSPDGAVLATAGNDRQIIFWATAAGMSPRVFARHTSVVSDLAFSPGGEQLAVLGFEDAMCFYDVADSKRALRIDCPCGDMRTLVYSPDGALLAAAGRNGRLRVWRTSDLSVVYTAPAHSLRIRDLVFSPEGTLLISAGEDRTIRAADARTGQEVFVLPTRGSKVYCLAPLGDGRLAAGGSDNLITIWDLQRRDAVAKLAGHTGTVAALAAAENVLASVSYDTTIRLWPTHKTPALADQPQGTRVGSQPQPGTR